MTAYEVKDAGDLRRYFIQIPNLIDDSQLSVYAFRLYVHLKRVAGDSGMCYQSTRTLADACKMSMGMVSKAKDELARARLILITVKSGEHGEFDSHEITIMDVWDENNARYSTCSPHEQDHITTRTGPSHDVNRTVSPHETKNNPIKNNPIKKMVSSVPIQDMEYALAEVCNLDYKLNIGEIRRESIHLFNQGYTSDQVRRFYGPEGVWFDVWPGSTGEYPTIKNIKKTIQGFTSGNYQREAKTKPGKVPLTKTVRDAHGNLIEVPA